MIIVVAASYGSYQVATGEPSGDLLLLAAGIFAVGYFRYGAIRPAFMALQRGDMDSARRLADTIKFPRLLSPQARSYLHWIHGVLAAQDNNLGLAEEQLRLAIDGRLRTSNDRCPATATLAEVVARHNDADRARRILKEAEQIPHKDRTSEYLDKLQAEFDKTK